MSSGRRFVLLSDLHAHPWSAFSKGDGLGNTRLRASLNILEASLCRAHCEGIPWIFAGDLVHTAGYALNTVLAGITDILMQWSEVEKLVVWGNHDARGVGGRITLDQTVFAGLARTIRMEVLDPTVVPHTEAGGLTFSGAGYQPRVDLLELPQQATDVGIYHQTVAGSRAANDFLLAEGLDPDLLLERHCLSIVGHIHHPQEISAPPGQAILIPGSPEHQNFGDHGDRGWWIVTMPAGVEHSDDCALGPMGNPQACDCSANDPNPVLEFIPGGSPEFRTVETPAEVQADGHFYRVRTMPVGASVPDGAIVVAPTPTTVAHRDVMRGVAEVDQILQVWINTQPPPVNGAVAKDYLTVGRKLLTAQEPVTLRNIQLTSLHLKNFCCFEEQRVWPTPGIHLVLGQGRDYPSNGAGKSSLIGEALYWLLFGRTTKGLSADEVIRWGEKECWVQTVLLDESKNNITITRRRDPDGHTLTVEQDGQEWSAPSVNEMTAKLGQYLGITPEIFQNLAYFSQEKLLLFSSATDGERKNVLADLIGLRAYQEASSAAGVAMAMEEKNVAMWAARAEALEEQLTKAQTDAVRSTVELEEWTVAHRLDIADALHTVEQTTVQRQVAIDKSASRVSHITALARVLTIQYQNRLDIARPGMEASIREETLKEHTDKRQTLENEKHRHYIQAMQGFTSLTSARQAVQGSPKLQQDLTEREEESAQLSIERVALGEKKAHYQAKLEQMEGTLKDLRSQILQTEDSLGQGICPTCQQSITTKHRERCLAPLLAKQGELLSVHEAQKETVKLFAQSYQSIGGQCEEAMQHIRQRRTLLAQLGKVAEALREADALHKRIEDMGKAVVPTHLVAERVEAQIALAISHYRYKQTARIEGARHFGRTQAEKDSRIVTQHQEAVRLLQQEQNPFKAILQSTTTLVTSLQEQLEKEQKQAEGIEKNIALYEYWRHGFSKQGLQSLLVEEIAVRFNANRADIFPLLTQGIYDVQFSTLSKTRAGELRERTEFLVFEHGKPIRYEALSGGQRRRVDIGIMLVLTQAVAEWMGTKGVLGLLILDEVFGFLDTSGAEGLLAALNQVTAQIPTIYVITHDTHLQSMIPNVIQVVQGKDGISKVV